MRFFRLLAITVLLAACVVLGSACTGAKGEQGVQGEQGPKGDTGAAGVGVENIVNNGDGTFTVSLTNGESYTTDNLTGARGEQGIQGVKGDTGMPGVGVTWQGQWDNSTVYGQNDGVGYQGSSYISKQDSNANHAPTDTAWWDLWIAKGDTGEQGIQGMEGPVGATGATGPAGPNMIVAMGYVAGDGTLMQGYNVDNVTLNNSLGRYEIRFTGFSYSPVNHVALVCCLSTSKYTATTGSAVDALAVYLFNQAGSTAYNAFQFVVMDMTP